MTLSLVAPDVMMGDAGDDDIYGGFDTDFLYGGTGNDYFISTASDGYDVVMDFTFGGVDDAIVLQGSGFSSVQQVLNSAVLYGGYTCITLNAATTVFIVNPYSQALTASDVILI
jgi:Ca2+-binding RTX toxin-like protein